ncbi:hypothetical protein [Nocardioides zeae]
MTAPGEYDEDDPDSGRAATSIWPHVEERVLDLVESHRSTIVFTNSRRVSERLTARLNTLAQERAEARDPGGGAADPGAPGPSRPPPSWPASPVPPPVPQRSSRGRTTGRSRRSSARSSRTT